MAAGRLTRMLRNTLFITAAMTAVAAVRLAYFEPSMVWTYVFPKAYARSGVVCSPSAEVTCVFARLAAAFSAILAMMRYQCAQNLDNPVIYRLMFFSQLVAIVMVAAESFYYETMDPATWFSMLGIFLNVLTGTLMWVLYRPLVLGEEFCCAFCKTLDGADDEGDEEVRARKPARSSRSDK